MDDSEQIILISVVVFLILLTLSLIVYMSLKEDKSKTVKRKKVYYVDGRRVRPGFVHTHRHRSHHPHFIPHETPNHNPHSHPHRHRWRMNN